MENYINCSLKDFENPANSLIYERANSFYDFFQYTKAKQHSNYRIVSKHGASAQPQIINPYSLIEENVISYVSNDYLGFTKHPKIIKAGIDALSVYGSGAGSSPLIGGQNSLHEELEKAIAQFFHKEAAITFTSGYAANSGTFSALLKKEDIAILDMGVHTSVIEGCSQTNKKYFLHNNLGSLEQSLEQTCGLYRNTFIIVDGVYSQDGDIAPLTEISALARKYNAFLVVDDAHGIGVIGKTGKGAIEKFDVFDKVDMITGTFSKTFASVGGYAVANKEIITLLKYYSAANIFSAAATPQSVATILKAIELLREEPIWQQKLNENINYFKQGLDLISIDYGNTESAIFPIMIRDEKKTMQAGKFLLENGIYANPIMYPAVSRKQTRIRMSLLATHTTEMLDNTLKVLETMMKELNINRR